MTSEQKAVAFELVIRSLGKPYAEVGYTGGGWYNLAYAYEEPMKRMRKRELQAIIDQLEQAK